MVAVRIHALDARLRGTTAATDLITASSQGVLIEAMGAV